MQINFSTDKSSADAQGVANNARLLTSPESDKQYFHLTSLAPKTDADDNNCSKYCKFIKSALENPTIKNIALTGHYGAGKSSILQSFQSNHGDHHTFLNISLATFCDKQNGNSTNGNTSEAKEQSAHSPSDNDHTNHLIEHSILQQIFYQVPKSSIPKSRFKRISKSSYWAQIYLLFWLLCVGAAFLLFRPQMFDNIHFVQRFLGTHIPYVNGALGIMAFIAFTMPVMAAVSLLRTIPFKKLRFSNCEIEIDDNKNPSVLNKHLDEILYFFEATKYDVVVIEDLDRFDGNDIFTKLREINTLINRNIEAHHNNFIHRIIEAHHNKFTHKCKRRQRVVFIPHLRRNVTI